MNISFGAKIPDNMKLGFRPSSNTSGNDYDAKKLSKGDLIEIQSGSGWKSHNYQALVLTGPDKKGDLKILKLNEKKSQPEIENTNISNFKVYGMDKFQPYCKKLGRLDVIL